MIVIGHHDRKAIERLQAAAAKRGTTVRVVDQKTAVLPLPEKVLANPDTLIAGLMAFFGK